MDGIKPYTPPANAPRGIRNNNPLNIREGEGGGDQWRGEAAAEIDAGFEEFDAPQYAYRAAVKVLRSYRKRGLITVEQIIAEWAPSRENNVEAYIASVIDQTGWQPGHVVAEAEGDYIALFRAMAVHENGRAWAEHESLSYQVIQQGVALA